MDAFVTGGGGEVGRAYYWRQLARTYSAPPSAVFGSDAWALMLAEAAECGLDGWRRLDAAYAEHRLTAWGRSMITRPGHSTVAAFADRDVIRGLLSLSADDRVSDGFHRRFLAESGVDAPPGPPGQRTHVPRFVRRAAALIRRRRSEPVTPAGPDLLREAVRELPSLL